MATTRVTSNIQEFYRDTSIFITGGTGFLGKLIIEKFLRSCPGIKKIYVLCRPKKGKDVNDRLAEQFDNTLYELVRKRDPEFKSKIVPIIGYCDQINLGIGEEDLRMLTNEVDVIFHCAATVRFDESLCTATLINIRGTRELLLLARGMKHLKALVHVSTAYSNCVHNHIEEKLYKPPFDGDQLMRLVESADEDTLKRITPGLLGEHPNTYTYTKGIAEDIVKWNSGGLPVCIVRPAIIISTYKDPLPGWCDNVYGATGSARDIFLGLLHTLHCDSSKMAALVPGDYVANVIIVAAWDLAQSWRRRQDATTSGHKLAGTNEIAIYNYTGCGKHALTWGGFMNRVLHWCYKIPTLNCSWICFLKMSKHKHVSFMYQCLFHFLPAYIVDGLLYCIGKQPRYAKNYKHIQKMYYLTSYFSNQQWKFDIENTRKLYAKINDTDKELFDFAMDDISWNEYMESFMTGIRVYVLKDPLTTLPRAKRKYMMLRVVNKILLIILVFVLYILCGFC